MSLAQLVCMLSERAPMFLVTMVGPYYMQVFGAVWDGGNLCMDPLSDILACDKDIALRPRGYQLHSYIGIKTHTHTHSTHTQ